MLAVVKVIEGGGDVPWWVPVITGVAGLRGVLVGAVVPLFVEPKLDREREVRAARVAARLLYDDLSTIRAMLQTTLDVQPPHVAETHSPFGFKSGWRTSPY